MDHNVTSLLIKQNENENIKEKGKENINKNKNEPTYIEKKTRGAKTG